MATAPFIEPPPLPSLPSLPSTPLLGRTPGLATARRLLLDHGVRLLTLTGPAGVGKTSLALAVASDVASAFADGARVVDLSAVRDPALVAASVARGVGVQGVVAERRFPAAVVEHLRDHRLLLLLDNLEQVRSAAPFLDALVAACPGLVLLATSREPLRLRREQIVPVPPLPLPEGTGPWSPDDIAGIPSVALFVRRAQSVNPAFTLTAANAAAVAKLCVRLDGLPLAIELAAPVTRLLDPAALLARLEGHLADLGWTAVDLPQRQQTLRAAIGWSYDLLSDAEGAVCRRLGAFVGGCTLDAADAVADAASLRVDAFETLAALVDKSLLQVVPTGAAAADGADPPGPRFRLLETIREDALERLTASGELEPTRSRHAVHFLALAERTAPLLLRPHGGRWLDRLEREHDNLRAALRWSLTVDRPDSAAAGETGLRLAVALWYFWWVRGYLAEGREWLARSLDRAPDAAAPLRARGLTTAGQLAQWQGDHDQATTLLRAGLSLFREIGDARGCAFALTNLGIVAWRQGDLARGTALHEEALASAREADDPWHTALVLLHLGLVTRLRGNDHRAAALLAEAVDIFREVGEAHLAFALVALAEVESRRRPPARAASLLAEALERCGEPADRSAVAFVSAVATGIVAAWADPLRVARLLGAADGLAEGTGWRRTPFEAAAYDRGTAVARAALGATEFAAAHAAGRGLSPERVVAEAVVAAAAGSRAAATASAAGHGAANPLSAREREVLALVAEGHSNREIGRALTIAERTATFHVTSILNKLGAETRAQAVAVAARGGLLGGGSLGG